MADNFTIIDQAERKVAGEAGRLIDAVVITFETKPSHLKGTVTVPVGDATADRVGPIVGRLAAEREAIQAL